MTTDEIAVAEHNPASFRSLLERLDACPKGLESVGKKGLISAWKTAKDPSFMYWWLINVGWKTDSSTGTKVFSEGTRHYRAVAHNIIFKLYKTKRDRANAFRRVFNHRGELR